MGFVRGVRLCSVEMGDVVTIEGFGDVEELRRKMWRSWWWWSYECAFGLGLEEGRLAGNYVKYRSMVTPDRRSQRLECSGEIQRWMYSAVFRRRNADPWQGQARHGSRNIRRRTGILLLIWL